jgi:hypothetical protein
VGRWPAGGFAGRLALVIVRRAVCLALVLLALVAARPALATAGGGLPHGDCCCPALDAPADDADRLAPRCGCELDQAPAELPPPLAADRAAAARAALDGAPPPALVGAGARRPPRLLAPPLVRPPPPRPSPVALHVRALV